MPQQQPRHPSEFETLADWRRLVLKKAQWQIAEAAFGDRERQPFISDIENGHLPSPLNECYDKIIKAYELNHFPAEFERMVKNGEQRRLDRKQRWALRKPVAETEPLIAQQKTYETPKIDPIFGAEETIRRAAEGSAEAQAILQEKLRKAKLG